jgi:hypothetical protein
MGEEWSIFSPHSHVLRIEVDGGTQEVGRNVLDS